MEGLEIPEELRAKLMAHLGVSGLKNLIKILFIQISGRKRYPKKNYSMPCRGGCALILTIKACTQIIPKGFHCLYYIVTFSRNSNYIICCVICLESHLILY